MTDVTTNTTYDPDPYFGYTWVHRKTGGEYSVICYGIAEATLTPVVIYKNVSTGEVWTRPCAEFFDGRFKARAINTITTGTNPK
jgi:hypothetical protein